MIWLDCGHEIMDLYLDLGLQLSLSQLGARININEHKSTYRIALVEKSSRSGHEFVGDVGARDQGREGVSKPHQHSVSVHLCGGDRVSRYESG